MYYLTTRYFHQVFYWGGHRSGWCYEPQAARLFRSRSAALRHVEQGKRRGSIPENTIFQVVEADRRQLSLL